jgi:V/A-type H+-transporting ATPase subunit E
VEVLNTGEELGRQILEDARKKASRMLETADRECAGIREAEQKTAADEIARLRAGGDRQLAAQRAEMEAALPLDFLRTRLSFIQDTVVGALREFFDGLAPEDFAQLLAARIRRVAGAFKGKTVTVLHGGLEPALVQATVARSAPGVTISGMKPLPGGRGIVIESDDGRVRFRCTTADLETELLEDRREDLAAAALGSEPLEAGA